MPRRVYFFINSRISEAELATGNEEVMLCIYYVFNDDCHPVACPRGLASQTVS
ncbi:MAG TPA: hypothetical protein LFV90_07090 [Rickettsia endosymbiont of Columbicola hoogstraali]|nr:hypothetical protein [Rickettsia endosymbiont of Columbicola hoogstraali]